MEIYEVTGEGREPVYFAKFDDISTTLRISYSTCISVDIIKSPRPIGHVSYTVTGAMPDNNGTSFKHVYNVRRLPVYERATHL
jgi:hypothetical protein